MSLPHIVSSVEDVTNTLPRKLPFRVVIKNDLEQPSGSFKLRGIGNLILRNIEKYNNENCHVYASSGGNAGLAAAYSARYFNVPATIVLPIFTKPLVKDKLLEYGANIIIYGKNIFEADNYLKEMIKTLDKTINAIYCHPFDNPLIWDGHSSIIDELVTQVDKSKIKGVVCSCGGGGLYNGIFQGLRRNDLFDSKILLLETVQAPTLSESIKKNEVITLSSVNSLATLLACSYTTQQSINNYHNSNIVTKIELIDDYDAILGCVDYYYNQGRVTEPACGASLSTIYSRIDLIYKHFGHLDKDDIVVVIACGGSCTSKQDLRGYESIIKSNEVKL